MQRWINFIYNHNAIIYRVFLWLITVFLMIYFFPEVSKFSFSISKDKVWTKESLVAPFDFPLYKTEKEIEEEKELRIQQIPNYISKDTSVYAFNNSLIQKLDFSDIFNNDFQEFTFKKEVLVELNKLQKEGIVANNFENFNKSNPIYIIEGKNYKLVEINELVTKNDAVKELTKFITNSLSLRDEKVNTNELANLKPNLILNEKYFQLKKDELLQSISPTKEIVKKGTEIIAYGQRIGQEEYAKIRALQKNQVYYDSKGSNEFVVWLGYTILIALALLMLLLFIKQYRPSIYENNSQLGFIFFNILAVYFSTIVVLNINYDYLFIVPICILPITLKAFFDARLGLFTHVITILIIGLIVSNSYEYMFLQFIAGIVTILTVSELYKRANLFISVGKITLVYLISYMAFHLIQEANLQSIDYQNLIYFLLSGVGLLFVQPLIYTFEKIFGMVSDLSLLELSDTNSKLLKRLSEIAPGTFHHSLNVANLAEASANEVGANSLLVRVGALYHDIGKMKNPMYFTENQMTSVNPHNEISPKESAKIIINHRIDGIEMAKKHKLPDRIIDFIRTHHGTSTVYYFYIKQMELEPELTKAEDFSYPGPLPFSKETAILMMCDAVEAASKSLKEPTAKLIDSFVEKIIQKQVDEQQFINANITFKEIESIKKILKAKLKNMYNLRVAYPD